MTDLLRQGFAPITDDAWKEINDTARKVLKTHLSARKLVDFNGPGGWETAAVNLGRIDYKGNKPVNGVGWGLREVLPLLEVRVPFTLSQLELDDITRGCRDAELAPLEKAAIAGARDLRRIRKRPLPRNKGKRGAQAASSSEKTRGLPGRRSHRR